MSSIQQELRKPDFDNQKQERKVKAMRITVATNFDDDLIRKIAEFGTVESVYGKLAADTVGGGRSSIILPQISRKDLRRHIDLCHQHGIEFNYLLNAACLDNRELIGPSHREIMGLVKQVEEDGADVVTVASHLLLGMIKSQFPKLKVATSVFMKPDTIDETLHLEKEGADEITLYYNFNRDFKLLKQVVEMAKPETVLRLVANNTCLHNCPYSVPGHAVFEAHSSQSNHESKGFALSIYTVLCGLEKMRDLSHLIMSDWIRPEDVPAYEALGGNLMLKLAERARKTDWLVRAVRAYSEQKYDGNLFDILNWIDGNYRQVDKMRMAFGALSGKARLTELIKLGKAAFTPPVFVDNSKFDRFIQHFQAKPCSERICAIAHPKEGNCAFCRQVAKKTVTIDEGVRQGAIKAAAELKDSVYSGRMF